MAHPVVEKLEKVTEQPGGCERPEVVGQRVSAPAAEGLNHATSENINISHKAAHHEWSVTWPKSRRGREMLRKISRPYTSGLFHHGPEK